MILQLNQIDHQLFVIGAGLYIMKNSVGRILPAEETNAKGGKVKGEKKYRKRG